MGRHRAQDCCKYAQTCDDIVIQCENNPEKKSLALQWGALRPPVRPASTCFQVSFPLTCYHDHGDKQAGVRIVQVDAELSEVNAQDFAEEMRSTYEANLKELDSTIMETASVTVREHTLLVMLMKQVYYW